MYYRPVMKARKSWREKLEDDKGLPRIVDVPPKMAKRVGEGKMLIPKPMDVDAMIKKVPKGKLITQSLLRQRLADEYGVNVTCPLTTGIFTRMAAEAAEEDLQKGKRRVTPYWRVVKDDGGMNEKFPSGTSGQSRRLRAEGHKIAAGKGKKPPRVGDLQGHLVNLG